MQWTEPDAIKANILSLPLEVPKILQLNGLAIDPLALILSGQLCVMLHLPDPPPA
jgi:hypothetical protein